MPSWESFSSACILDIATGHQTQMQANPGNRDAFAGSGGEDQPKQQTAWRRSDPGSGGSQALFIPATRVSWTELLLALNIIDDGLRDNETNTPIVIRPDYRFAMRVKTLQIAQTKTTPQNTRREVTVEPKAVIDQR